ncbi:MULTISPECIES: GNAT family N-acetyltransferase [Shewanella]|uniref:GNAT family N-acetyltransferase n=1 Tax=Shewanella marisflavi TaxID=260364 RepID=A0ABX5WMP6_9GAMM|nr:MULTISPECIES: GNAT family N-acetyltransferase [Shewanella]QDF75863.1 GNAT family N-acetyltransferase [Shewanella marisflavi]
MTYIVKKIDVFDEDMIADVLSVLNTSFIGDFNFTAEWFRWKHIDSYYGQSLAWGAFYNDHLVGIRLYSKWHSFGQAESYLQAVDTATLPEHQRKGIFALLIKESLKYIDDNKIKVFNFPNKNSYNQYLKYGWKDSTSINWFFSIFWQAIIPKSMLSYSGSSVNSKCKTSLDFIEWRFCKNPSYQYEVFFGEYSVIVFKKVKKILTYYQVVYCDFDDRDIKSLNFFLSKNKIFITRAISSDLGVVEMVKIMSPMILKNGNKGFNFVTRGVEFEPLSVSLADTDFI